MGAKPQQTKNTMNINNDQLRQLLAASSARHFAAKRAVVDLENTIANLRHSLERAQTELTRAAESQQAIEAMIYSIQDSAA